MLAVKITNWWSHHTNHENGQIQSGRFQEYVTFSLLLKTSVVHRYDVQTYEVRGIVVFWITIFKSLKFIYSKWKWSCVFTITELAIVGYISLGIQRLINIEQTLIQRYDVESTLFNVNATLCCVPGGYTNTYGSTGNAKCVYCRDLSDRNK